MKGLSIILAAALVLSTILLGGCGDESGAAVEKVNLGFGGAVVVNENGQAIAFVGEEMTAVATVKYSNAGSIKGEWTVDGKKEAVTLELPEINESQDEEDATGFAIAPVVYELPTDSAGLHTVSFSLTSPERISSDSIEYVAEESPPPANADDYTIEMFLQGGKCIEDNDSGVRGNSDELALAITVAVVEGQSQNRILLEGDAGKVYPPGNDILTTPGQPFAWDAYIGGPWTIDEGDKLNIKAYLYEIDGGAFDDAVLQYTGFSVPGSKDDFIGSVSRDIKKEMLSRVNKDGPQTIEMHFYNGDGKGDFKLYLVIKSSTPTLL